jgi:anti-anti-sigma regulatory factor
MQPSEFELKSLRNGSILIIWLCGRLAVDNGAALEHLEQEISKQDVDYVLLDLSRLIHLGAGILPALENLVQRQLKLGVNVRLCLLPGDLKNQLAELAKTNNVSAGMRRAA